MFHVKHSLALLQGGANKIGGDLDNGELAHAFDSF